MYSNTYQHRQRSFDDTESNRYMNIYKNNKSKYSKQENPYEYVHEEPTYQNTNAAGRIYGRLDVIGHGIGRIERHLSSSCGNIDHYNFGSNHYAVLGHSHLGTVGHIHLNNTSSSSTIPNAKTRQSFFSCLGGENSQSMNNLQKAGTEDVPTNNNQSTAPSTLTASSSANKQTGAIPKLSTASGKNKASAKDRTGSTKKLSPSHNSAPTNRISKSSLQWLLVNKWLPWQMSIGQGADYKVIDFNFMFSRNCDGCDASGAAGGSEFNYSNATVNPQDLTCYERLFPATTSSLCRYYENINGEYQPPPQAFPGGSSTSQRIVRPSPAQLQRLKAQYDGCGSYRNNSYYDCGNGGSMDGGVGRNFIQRHPQNQQNDRFNFTRSREFFNRSYETVTHSCDACPANTTAAPPTPKPANDAELADPFRNWASFNFEDNTFRPANGRRDIRRITDGTYCPRDMQDFCSKMNDLDDDEEPLTPRALLANVESDLEAGSSKTFSFESNSSASSRSSEESQTQERKRKKKKKGSAVAEVHRNEDAAVAGTLRNNGEIEIVVLADEDNEVLVVKEDN